MILSIYILNEYNTIPYVLISGFGKFGSNNNWIYIFIFN